MIISRTPHVTGFLARGIAVMMLLVACGGGGSDSTDPVSTLGITPASATISVNESNQFSATNAQGAVTWTSSNESVATVVGTGYTTAHAPGTATITARDSRGSATASVTVKSAAAVVLSSSALTFAQQSGAADAASQTVQVTDGGDDKVGALSIASITATGGQSTSWLTATLSGTAAPATLTVHASAGALTAGVYSATISIAATGAKNGAQSVVVTFTVSAAPALQLSSSSLLYTQVRGASAVSAQTVNATNSGGGTLTGIATSIAYQAGQSTGWLSVTLDKTVAPAVLTVLPALGSLANGTYNATITVSATGASNAPQTVAVTFVVAAQPAINVSSGALTFTSVRGGSSTPQVVVVNNSGGGTLTGLSAAIRYTAGQSTGWLTATLDASTAPANLTVTPTIGALVDGTYNANVDITSANGSNNPQSIAVTFTVSSTGTIALSTQTLAFAAAPAGANPAAQIVTVSNGAGSGVLGGLTTLVTYTVGQPTGWLTATLSSGSSPATITAQAVTGALATGTYTANIRVSSTTASNSPRDIVVTFVVSATPAIALTGSALTFNTTRGTEAATQVVGVSNGGGGNLTGLTTSIAYQPGQPSGWLAATLSATSSPANVTVQALIGALPNGTYNATISVASAVASNSPRTIAVTFTIVAGPAIGVTSTNVSFAATRGGASPAAQMQSVMNTGAGALTGLTVSVAYTSGGSPGWLAASLSASTPPSVLTLTATTGALAAGTYIATVSIAAPGASNSPVAITVTFVVAAPPTLVLGSSAVNYSGTHKSPGSALYDTPVAVTRLGGGTLTNLSVAVSAGASSWLSATLNTTVTPAVLTITANANARTPQTTAYTATVTVSSSDATNSPQTIAVSFTSLYSLSLDLYPVIANQCTGCHYSGGQAPLLNSSDNFWLNLVNAETSNKTYPLAMSNSHHLRIKPGDASSSYVVDEVVRTPGSNFMPPTGSPAVLQSTRDILIAWINQGALKN